MTDHQTMIREVCEKLGKLPPESEFSHTLPIRPDERYDHCHLLIEWMTEAGWDYISITYKDGLCRCHLGSPARSVHADSKDDRIAVLTAAWRAVTDE